MLGCRLQEPWLAIDYARERPSENSAEQLRSVSSVLGRRLPAAPVSDHNLRCCILPRSLLIILASQRGSEAFTSRLSGHALDSGSACTLGETGGVRDAAVLSDAQQGDHNCYQQRKPRVH